MNRNNIKQWTGLTNPIISTGQAQIVEFERIEMYVG